MLSLLRSRRKERKRLKKGKRRFWVHPIQEKRPIYGAFHHLVDNLEADNGKFKDFFRVSKKNVHEKSIP